MVYLMYIIVNTLQKGGGSILEYVHNSEEEQKLLPQCIKWYDIWEGSRIQWL